MTTFNIFNKQNFETLIRKNWTSFLNSQKLMALIIQAVQNTQFEPAIHNPKAELSHRFAASHLEFTTNGLLLWIEFNTLRFNDICNGTCELHINPEGEVQVKQIIGQLFLNR